mmetsp:Transcript_39601/g.53824  ORF Transcript_39601/g.53824 Transcript_39601/m.53824 type:complete len:645 (-) Transcript_39601:1395-3329(-)
MDDMDYLQGHGTHVSGSALGQVHSADKTQGDTCHGAQLEDFNGMAEDASLLFVDLQCNTEGGCTCGNSSSCPCVHFPNATCPKDGYLYPPPHMNDYLAPLHALGARVNSNSWGSDCGTGLWCSGYGSGAMEVDEFVSDNPDMIVLFAAGNSGEEEGFSSLTGESYSKNGISVGAAMTTSAGMRKIMGDLRKPSENRCKVYGDHERHDMCMVEPCLCSSSNHSCKTSCDSGCSEQCWKNQFDPANHIEVEDDMAFFSSLGPTSDGRRKPDLVAPGFYIASARSHSQQQPCGSERFCNGTTKVVNVTLVGVVLSPFGEEAQYAEPSITDGPSLSSTPSPSNGPSHTFAETKTHTPTTAPIPLKSFEASSANEIAVDYAHSIYAMELPVKLVCLGEECSCSTQLDLWVMELATSEASQVRWAKLANTTLHLNHTGSVADDWSVVRRHFVEPVHLWANHKYLVGFTASITGEEGCETHLPAPSKTNKSDLSASACFGYWITGHEALTFGGYDSSKLECATTSTLEYGAIGENAEKIQDPVQSYASQSQDKLQSRDSGELLFSDSKIGAGLFFPIGLDLRVNRIDRQRNALAVMAGTSMATPIAAGSATLVRAYFMNGHFENASGTLDTLLSNQPVVCSIHFPLAASHE